MANVNANITLKDYRHIAAIVTANTDVNITINIIAFTRANVGANINPRPQLTVKCSLVPSPVPS